MDKRNTSRGKHAARRRSIAVAVTVPAVVGIGFVALQSGSSPAGALDLALDYADGTEGNVSDFQGKPVVLNFWASWCPACVAEMPDFEAVHQTLGEDVQFIGIKMQDPDTDGARQLLANTGVSYPIAHDPSGSIFRRFGGIAMPTTVLTSADGEIISTHAGAIFADDLERLIRTELLDS